MDQSILIRKAKRGDKQAFEELLMLHSDQLYRTAFLYTGNREDALDIVQETSYKAYQAIGTLKNEQYFLTWLTRILINSAYEMKRKSKKELPIELAGEFPAKGDDGNVDQLDLINAINKLRGTYRDAIVLFYYHDLPIKEVAKVMNIPENTVKTYLLRGKNHLKRILEGTGYHEGNLSNEI
jgi:RNA polymerase sigma-70 factor (ECF subfamily)